MIYNNKFKIKRAFTKKCFIKHKKLKEHLSIKNQKEEISMP